MHLRILIAALGGEGGGVLAGWITDAAIAAGLAAQRTSIPGVAQRTGATTYYLEMMDVPDGKRPIMALNPAPGEVDLVVASELMEAARVVQAGFITPERTRVLASTHRVYTIQERITMGDGRADPDSLRQLVERFSKAYTIVDFGAVAAANGCHVNSVLLGAMSQDLPFAADHLRDAIRQDGRAVEANLRGFDAGRSAVAGAGTASPASSSVRNLRTTPPEGLADLLNGLPASVGVIASEGMHRLVDFQDSAYARRYGERVQAFARLPAVDDHFLMELARHLAVRMSSEDTIRVAQLKLRDERLSRLAQEAKARDGDLVEVIEYLKPGPEELLSMLPARIARPMLRVLTARGWNRWSLPLKIRTSGVFGFLALRLLAGCRSWRPRSLRAAEERACIEEWLLLVERAHAIDPEAARQVVETASLVRGYGDTWKRGCANWRRIADEVIEPMLAGQLSQAHFADAVLQARLAAQAHPDGRQLTEMIASLRSVTA